MRICYIGDALTSEGLRLVGATAQPLAVDADAVWNAIEDARDRSDLILLNQAHAQVVPHLLEKLLVRHPIPPILVVPSIDTDDGLHADGVDAARRVLGVR